MDPAVPAVSSKSKARFVLLGGFLGMLGVHNLYAGFRGKGIAQLAITLFTLGLGIPVSWIWAVIDVCTVERDSAGVQFRS
jgi:TM2 domain-containing membrane protein YozV